MPKVGMPEIRKPQLVRAAIQAIDKYGFSGATVGVISKKAGVSPAIINHYFGGKNGLFEETMKTLIREFFEILGRERALLKNSTTKEKVMAIVRACINQAQTRPEIVKVWMGFWASSMHSPSLFRLQNVYARRLQTALVIVLKESFDDNDARKIATTLAAMIDGLWLRGSLAGDLDCDKAAEHISDYLDLVFEC